MGGVALITCFVFLPEEMQVTLQWYWLLGREGGRRVLNKVFVKCWASFFPGETRTVSGCADYRGEVRASVWMICKRESDGTDLLYLLGLALWEFLVDHLLLEDPEGGNTHTNPSLASQCVIVPAVLSENYQRSSF